MNLHLQLKTPSSSNLNLQPSPISATPASSSSCRTQTPTRSLTTSSFDPVPSQLEIQSALDSLQNFLQWMNSCGNVLRWVHPIFESWVYDRVFDAFCLLQTEPSVKRVVVSLASDKAVWDAITNNELVRELRQSARLGERRRVEGSYNYKEGESVGRGILRWIWSMTMCKIAELMEKFQSLVNEMFKAQVAMEERNAGANGENLEEKLALLLLLSVVILLIVVIARAQEL